MVPRTEMKRLVLRVGQEGVPARLRVLDMMKVTSDDCVRRRWRDAIVTLQSKLLVQSKVSKAVAACEAGT